MISRQRFESELCLPGWLSSNIIRGPALSKNNQHLCMWHQRIILFAPINVMPEGGGGARDRVGTLIRNKNLESNFLTLGIRFQFKVPHHQTENSQAIWSKEYVLAFHKTFSLIHKIIQIHKILPISLIFLDYLKNNSVRPAETKYLLTSTWKKNWWFVKAVNFKKINLAFRSSFLLQMDGFLEFWALSRWWNTHIRAPLIQKRVLKGGYQSHFPVTIFFQIIPLTSVLTPLIC